MKAIRTDAGTVEVAELRRQVESAKAAVDGVLGSLGGAVQASAPLARGSNLIPWAIENLGLALSEAASRLHLALDFVAKIELGLEDLAQIEQLARDPRAG